jgi:hypothetical protein
MKAVDAKIWSRFKVSSDSTVEVDSIGAEQLKAKLDQIRQDLLCNAFEGGSNYWYRIEEFNYPAGTSRKDVEYPHLALPFLKGGSLLISTGGDHPNPNRKDGFWTLNHAALIKGWKLMHDEAPRHYGNAISEDHDAETGDVYLQMCLFGEVVFG